MPKVFQHQSGVPQARPRRRTDRAAFRQTPVRAQSALCQIFARSVSGMYTGLAIRASRSAGVPRRPVVNAQAIRRARTTGKSTALSPWNRRLCASSLSCPFFDQSRPHLSCSQGWLSKASHPSTSCSASSYLMLAEKRSHHVALLDNLLQHDGQL